MWGMDEKGREKRAWGWAWKNSTVCGLFGHRPRNTVRNVLDN